MVKLRPIKHGNPRILSHVILVARNTVIPVHSKVVTTLQIELLLDLDMTRQAFHPADFLANLMTVRAMIHSL
jgi:hypothetical protein